MFSPQSHTNKSTKDIQKRESLKLVSILIEAHKLRGETLLKTSQYAKAAKDFEKLVDFAGF